MTMRPSIVTLLTAALLMVATSVWADDLSNQEIEQFIASMEKLQTMDDEFTALEEKDNDESQMPDTNHLVSEGLAQLRGDKLYDKVDSIARDHGFDNAEAWSQTGDRILNAYIALQMSSQPGSAQREMDKAMQAINENPQLTPAQKEQMRAMMTQSMATMKSFSEAPPEDMAAVKPYQKQLNQVMEYDKQQPQ
jgi:hypothetical protein